ncbi:GMC oxidoreductase-domain-containing protein, partial [Phycomyces nitens]
MTKAPVKSQKKTCYFGSRLNPTREGTLLAILSTILAPLTPEEKDSLEKDFTKIPNLTCTQKDIDIISDLNVYTPGVYDAFLEFMSEKILPKDLDGILGLLDALSTPAGMEQITGNSTPFERLTKEEQTDTFLSWKFSKDPQLVAIYKTFAIAILSAAYNMSDSPHQAATGYPGKDPVRSDPGYVPCIVRERHEMMTAKELLDPSLKFDAIIIGSGAGGGVCAAELSQAGLSVLVLEKGKYYHETELVSDVPAAYKTMYLQGGSFASHKGEISVLAGSTFGGATTINFLASLKPQHFVREEWAKMGLTHFTSSKFSDDLDKVYERIGATTDGIKHNNPNQILVDGCKQNTGGRSHECGWCLTGCKDGIKNGTSNSWLRIAAKHGARFVDQAKVNRVITVDGKATGVEFQIGDSDETFILNSSRVVVSAG